MKRSVIAAVFLIVAGALFLAAGCPSPVPPPDFPPQAEPPTQPAPERPSQPAESIVLEVPLVRQQTEVWCWAAVSEMVFRYFGYGQVQCAILSRWVGQDCCLFPGAPICLQLATLTAIQQTLYEIGGLRSAVLPRPLSFAEIREEIAAGRPIIVSYQGSFIGHVVVIVGYDDRGNVYIRDPYYGNFIVPYGAAFVYAGNTNMRWAQTIYRIRPISGA